ncbi:MAG TPA: DUF6541 family protein [Gaiellaceae bacterium]|jgi:hypothetical protein|nr:DUF6541 family protein [Gaiellaceae bacterium]
MAVVSQQIRLHRTGAGRIGSSVLFLAILAAAPAALGLARLLPPDGAGLALRLGAASCCILLVPGAIVVRALGCPAALGVAVAASLAWSLALLAGALALTFALNGSIETTLWLVAAAAVAALVPALARAPVASERSERLALLGVLAGGVAFAGAVWWAADTIQGDALFHLGRVRKLETLHLSSVNVVDEFRDGGLHPGYAFPLWHAALALVARLAGVDPAVAVQHAPAVLTPLALVLAYAAGAAVFRSYGGGIAVAAAQAGLLGFSRAGTGSFDFLALPPAVARALLAPALLALVFSLAAGGRRRNLLSIAAASVGLAIVHPTYAFFIALPLAGFLLARLALAPHRWREALRIAVALPAVLIPAGLYALWLRPIVDKTVSHDPDAAERARGVAKYAGQIDVIDGSFRLAPELISRGGAVTVAGLLAIPLAALAGGRRWAAYVLGASLAILPVVLFPFAFTELSDAVSLSQSRRLIAFLPIPFALAGGASLLGRLRLAGCLAAFAAGGALQLLYPGEFTYRLILGGPAWTVWVAIVGAGAALVAAAVVRKTLVDSGSAWTAAVTLAFVAPIAGAGFVNLQRDEPDPIQLTPGLVHALRTHVGKRDVVFSDIATSYRIAAYVPVYVAAAPPAHVADTEDNRPYERRMDVIEFFRTGDLAIPRRYRAGWIVVARRRFKLELPMRPVYEDERFALFRLRANS